MCWLAARNVVDPRAQAITSAGAGPAAAIAINADLADDDVDSHCNTKSPHRKEVATSEGTSNT